MDRAGGGVAVSELNELRELEVYLCHVKEESGRLKLKAENKYADDLQQWMECRDEITKAMRKELGAAPPAPHKET